MKQPGGFLETVTESFCKHLDLYTLAASATGVSLLAWSQPAEAEVVYTPTNQRISVHIPFNLDLNNDGITDFQILNKRWYDDFKSAFVGELGVNGKLAANRIVGNSKFAAALHSGVTIGEGVRFPQKSASIMAEGFYRIFDGSSCCESAGPWRNVTNRYLGLKFSINGETHFGWARLTVELPASFPQNISAELTGYAYETEANKAIKTGQTTEDVASSLPLQQPDPRDQTVSTLGLLALGSVQPFWRREEIPNDSDRWAE